MAGRAAEEVVYGEQEVTSGASSDFNQATKMAYNMVTKWGMSDKVGFVYHTPQERKPSPDTMRQIDGEIKGLLEKQYDYAKDILITHRNELDALANALLDKETMTGEEISQLLKIDTIKKARSLGTLPITEKTSTTTTPTVLQHNNNNNANSTTTTTTQLHNSILGSNLLSESSTITATL